MGAFVGAGAVTGMAAVVDNTGGAEAGDIGMVVVITSGADAISSPIEGVGAGLSFQLRIGSNRQ